jgi:hypothetical protein
MFKGQQTMKKWNALDWVICWVAVVLAFYFGAAMYFLFRASTQKAAVTYWEKKYNEEKILWQNEKILWQNEMAKYDDFCKEHKRASICK